MRAAWWLGAVPQPIDPRLSARERAEIIELADSSLVVGVPASELAEGRQVLGLDELNAASTTHSPYDGEPRISPVWKAVTSGGSTGRPKLIVACTPADADAVVGL